MRHPYPFSSSWDRPGPRDTVLQCLHRDTLLLQQQNTKKQYRTKNNCTRVQLGQVLDKRHKETQRPHCHFWRARSKGTASAPCTQHHLSSVQFSRSVVSDSLWPHGRQHARPPRPSPTPGARSNSRPSSRWCHPTILSSVAPFSSCSQPFPASRSVPMSRLFVSGDQSHSQLIKKAEELGNWALHKEVGGSGIYFGKHNGEAGKRDRIKDWKLRIRWTENIAQLVCVHC